MNYDNNKAISIRAALSYAFKTSYNYFGQYLAITFLFWCGILLSFLILYWAIWALGVCFPIRDGRAPEENINSVLALLTGIGTTVLGLVLFISWAYAKVLRSVLNVDCPRDNKTQDLYSNLLSAFKIAVLWVLCYAFTIVPPITISASLILLADWYVKNASLSFFIFFLTLLFLIISGVYIFARFLLGFFFVVDKQMGIIKALCSSWQVSKGNIVPLMGIVFLNMLFNLIPPGVVLLLFQRTCLFVYVYRQLTQAKQTVTSAYIAIEPTMEGNKNILTNPSNSENECELK